MTAHDDRQEFEEHKQRQTLAMGDDRELFRQSLETLYSADKYSYSYLWSWLGVPIIQLPADVMATQEVIWATRPDVIIETGVARGGALIFMASLLELIGRAKSSAWTSTSAPITATASRSTHFRSASASFRADRPMKAH